MIVGYSYAAENLCPPCTTRAMRASGIVVPRGRSHEDAIRAAAEKLGIDFEDQRSYDSAKFPKPVTDQQCVTELNELPDGRGGNIADERCTGDKCGKWLKLGEKSPTENGLARWVRDTYELPQALARDIAGELRRWGLSHPEFISEDDVREAGRMFPHDYATVHFSNQSGLGLMPTPEYDGDKCFYCEAPWEEHLFTCGTCGIDVPADKPHTHQRQIKGQIKFREVKGA
ncbi:hypothetical protein [Streptomyces sp. NPDC001089]